MKKSLSLFIVLVLVIGIIPITFADPVPYYETVASCNVVFDSLRFDIGKCTTIVTTYDKVQSATIDMELREYDGSSWKTVASWHKSYDSAPVTLEKHYATLQKGYYYQVVSTISITTDAGSDHFTLSSITSQYEG